MSFPIPALAYWVDTLDPVIFHVWGPISLRWYGLAYVSGFVAAYLLWMRASRKGLTPLTQANIEELMTWGIAGVIVGGRLGFMLLYDFGGFMQNPLSILRVDQGGMSFHGGAAGCLIVTFLVSWRRKLNVFKVGDLAVMGVSWGLLFGRLANFINGELWGKVSTVDWAVIFPRAPLDHTAATVFVETAKFAGLANPRHPSQLYEAATEGLLLGVIALILFWKTPITRRVPGLLSGLYFMGYAGARIFCEMFREPDASLIWGLSRGSVYSFAMVLFGAALIVVTIVRATSGVTPAMPCNPDSPE
ncbi:MAG: prolipoprotein diacylglyceryl transferase [Opitutales bacterium]|jgi:phosphatidylglycerol:prolipoprotein diacylglycerol transferase